MPSDPKVVAERGLQIYAAKYQRDLEVRCPGQYVAIDVESEEAFIRSTPEDALQEAQTKRPGGMFHLVKIGSPGVFRVAFSLSGAPDGDWIFGR